MNRIDFDQVGGYRLETQTFSEMQKNYNLLQALGEVLGKRAIVKGCVLNGSTVTDGVIYWDGELIEFKGGNIQSKIVIVESSESILFLDGNQKPTFYRRHATFGTGVNSVNWVDFKTVYPLSSALFIDEVRMYAGDLNKIAWGWYICNGQNGTLDMRDQFPVGYNPDNIDYDAIGKKVGVDKVTLTKAQMPIHDHGGSTSNKGNHRHSFSYENSLGSGSAGSQDGTSSYETRYTSYEGDHSHTVNNDGGGESHENRPPATAVVFIQFKGI